MHKAPIASFATVTKDNKPWVRYVEMSISDDLTIRFSTFANARKVKQVKNNPEVHLVCGISNIKKMDDVVQIQGIATVTKGKKEREAFWNKDISQFFESPSDPNYAIIVVKPYRIEYLDINNWEAEVWTQKK